MFAAGEALAYLRRFDDEGLQQLSQQFRVDLQSIRAFLEENMLEFDNDDRPRCYQDPADPRFSLFYACSHGLPQLEAENAAGKELQCTLH